MRIVIIAFVFITFASASAISQELEIKAYNGIFLNHSQRAMANLGLGHDNYSPVHLFGLDIHYVRNKIGFGAGLYTNNYVSDFNLRFHPLFPSTDKKFLTLFRAYGIKADFQTIIYENKLIKVKINIGLDYSYSSFNKANDRIPRITSDSIIYYDNRLKIDITNFLVIVYTGTIGIHSGVACVFKINDRIDLAVELLSRLGFSQKYQMYHSYVLSDERDGYKSRGSAHVLNKGDLFGINIGFVYKVPLKRKFDNFIL